MERSVKFFLMLTTFCVYCYGGQDYTAITFREEDGTFLEGNDKMMSWWNKQMGRHTFQYVPRILPVINDTTSVFNKLTKACYIVAANYTFKRSCFIAPVFANYWYYPKKFATLNYPTWMQHKQPLPIPENVYKTHNHIYSSWVNYTVPLTKLHTDQKQNQYHNRQLIRQINRQHLSTREDYTREHLNKLHLRQLSNKPKSNIFSLKSTLLNVMQMSSAILTGTLTQYQLYTMDMNLTNYLNTQLLHHQYLVNRTNQFDKLFATETNNTHQFPTQNAFQVLRKLNGILFYHVDCPTEDVNLIIVVQGKIISKSDNLDTVEKCGYLRSAVRIALNTFNYNDRFHYIELPSEWIDDTDSDLLQIDDMQISKTEILNFRFVSARHTLYHTSKNLSEMCETLEPDVVAHKVGHNIHLNSNYSFCINDVYSAIMEVLFKCQYDLISILHHELAHYFISSCHTNTIDFLGDIEFSFVRDLSRKARIAMENAWRMENLQLLCP